ncbi:hypothetical protein [Bacillus cereus]|uniref:hypothetical protein n=1 Tax=Bacillus cereus group TaxID=86661 RepID=UPI0001A00D2E|nr:hypothetical protein [Bacillus cereus]EEK76878.1 hypothetical protein bcere0009_42000 [Bacillus cereus R309803]HDR4560936.1 hypothetical protein [Bacillus luti]HDR4564097.1 hypothetical protein [Bacillus luti]
MKTIIEIEATEKGQINHDNIKRQMYSLNEKYGNDITVKFSAKGTANEVVVNK